jgi:hypothetical protein
MMRFAPESRRRSIIPLLGIALAAGYLSGFAPLSHKADSLDAPLEQAWRKLAATLGQTNAVRLDFVAITNQLAETRNAIITLDTARKQAQARIEPGESLRAHMSETFQLVDYDTEVGRRMSDLVRLAAQQKVTLEPAVFAGFPEQTAEVTEPELLWAELKFIDCLLTGAINSRIAAIHSVSALALLTNAPPTNGVRTLAELPVQLEFSGPAPNVARFLQSLPLRGEELQAAGLPEAPTNKPALFVDRLVLRKESPDKRDEIRVSLRAMGFVLRE